MQQSTNKGFSIIELVVVMALMTIILGVTLSTDRRSQNALKQINATYEVALFVREAQIEGTSVVEQAGTFDHAVGVHVSNGSTLTKYLDVSGDGWYDSSSIDTELGTVTLRDGATISRTCAGTEAEMTSDPVGGNCTGDLSVAFKRPHPDALVYIGASGPAADVARIEVTLDGITRHILIYNTGLISVE
jgi:prepilin-type N-terminal cleavage/methylation domain-containing protein